MTYPELLSQIYARFARLSLAWEAGTEKAGHLGVLTFLPEGYAKSRAMDQVTFEFWAMAQVREFLEGRGQTFDGIRELLGTFQPGREFLVMIIEPVEGPRKHAVHVHRIGNLGVN